MRLTRTISLLFLLLVACSNNKETVEQYAFPEMYIISLERTPERFQFVSNQLKDLNVSHEKFEAIDGYALTFQDTANSKSIYVNGDKNRFKLEKNRVYDVILHDKKLMQIDTTHRRFSLGEIGCACSHREIWKQIASGKMNEAIVFEDDVIFEPYFKENLQKYMQDLPADWDIAFLGVGRRNNKYGHFVCVGEIFRDFDEVPNHPNVAKIQPTNLSYGMYGYIINAKGARKLLELTDKSAFPIDDIVYQQGGINTGKIQGYVAMKKLLEPKLTDSEIKKMGRNY